METYYHKIRKVLRDNQLSSYKICYILKDEFENLNSVAFDTKDTDNIVSITINPDESAKVVEETDWDFNVDDFLFCDLEKGYEIAYMDLVTHNGVWNSISERVDEIEHIDGMQKYLSFCRQKGITFDVLEACTVDPVDISYLYKESNNSYKIIDSMVVQDEAIVLGFSPTNPSPYVTWKTSSDRSDGYRSGHYFVDKKDARRDFVERAKSLFNSSIKKYEHKKSEVTK